MSACPIRGKQAGTRALCRGRSSYSTQYTFTDGTQAKIALKASLVPNASGKLRRKWLAFILIVLDWKPDKVYQEYRRRFGIECSDRMLRRVRAATTSRNPALRFFLSGLGLILVHAWVFLRCTFSRLMHRGPRRVDVSRFRLNRFTKFLIRTVEKSYGSISSVPTHLSPQSVIY